MRIGIEVQRLFRKEKFGIETSALQLIRKLQEQNPCCDFIIYAKDDVDRQCLQEAGNLKIKKLNGKIFADFEQIFLPVAARRDRVDILHCTGNTAPVLTTLPVVQTLHDVIFMDAISRKDTLYQQWGNYYRRIMVPLVTKKSEMVITVSNYEKQRILNRIKIDDKKIRVIYNGIDDQRFRIKNLDSFQSCQVQNRYSLPANFILFLGNTSTRKNASRVIESFCIYASREDNPLPLVTPGLSMNFVSGLLAKLGQQDKIKYIITPGYIRDEDLPAVYGLSTLFLFPSLSEGFGMPVIEAMASGTPVITSNVSCLPEIAGDAAVLVDPTRAQAIADAISVVLTHPDLRITKIAAGLKNAARFSWSNTAAQVFEVYEQVCFQARKVGHTAAPVSYELR
ncbi:MAG TPA: glycosyltransferase family 1 protein [Chryseosolibacter sp.]|nr:glycosyltransferase family 1 protein [Chryseosolibacter sp.]